MSAAGALALALPSAAQADWMEASSTHFVIYADESAKDVREFAEDLERFHSALEFLTRAQMEEPSPSNRVTIYVVGSERNVRKVFGDGSDYLAGFYIPRAGGSLAIVPQVGEGRRRLREPMIILLHEYAHHFFWSSSGFPLPRWMSEGGAEFYASASFGSDGTLSVGMPALHRAGELLQLEEVPVAELFDEDLYRANRGRGQDSFYGRSWLLYHYLQFSKERSGQLASYFRLLTSGVPSIEAANKAFGDMDQLERELDRYLRQRSMMSLKLQPEMLATGEIAVRPLRKGEAAMMPVRIRSKRGVTREQALELLVDAREVAAQYPEDPMVQAALAEAEFDAGNDAQAIAAADAALAADPGNVDAYVQKGYALFRTAEEAEDSAAAYNAAMRPFVALNRIENNHPLPLEYHYRGFLARGEEPSELAVQGLERAVELARFDLDLRMMLALQQVRDGEFEKARASLAPIAYHPHGGGMARSAQRLMERLEDTDHPVDSAELALLFAPEAEAEDGGGSGGGTGEE